MTIYDSLIAKAIGGSGGGGGSSGTLRHIIFTSPVGIQLEYMADFDNEPYRMIGVPYVNGVPYYSYEATSAETATGFEYDYLVFNENDTVKMGMEPVGGRTVQVTGDISFEDDGWWYFNITGNGTITIS